jgi:DNA-binding CsgD family transcriptional regulator
LTTPVVIVDEDGGLVHTNSSASALISVGDVVQLKGNTVTAVNEGSRAALTQILASGTHAASSLPLRKRQGGDLIASVLPLSNSGSQSKLRTSHAAIFFHDPDREIQLPGEALAKLYRLTGAELRLLLALAHGLTLLEVAGKSGTALTTVRSHLKNLFEKTGKSRQSELVQLAFMTVS